MNFDWIPELHYEHGYACFWVANVVIMIGLVSWMKWNNYFDVT
jgi:Mg2+ and Co2+ transporter CorA